MDLFTRTAATGLYSLAPGSAVFRELTAYEAAFDLLSPALARCEAPFFSPDAGRAQLERLCTLCGFQVPPETPLSNLREAAAALLRGPGYTVSALETHLCALGAEISLSEGEPFRVFAEGAGADGLFRDNASLLAYLQALMPVGTGVADNLGRLSWERLDMAGLTASEFDKKDLTWTAIDAGELPETG